MIGALPTDRRFAQFRWPVICSIRWVARSISPTKPRRESGFRLSFHFGYPLRERASTIDFWCPELPATMQFPRAIRILLVEDSPDHALFFKAALRKGFAHDHEVKVAASLSECFESLADETFDLIVLDLGLPESQGLETVETFFQVRGLANPVIVLTAESGNGIGEQSLRIGAIDFLGKGQFDAEQLARTMRYSLERWRQRMALEKAQRDLKSFAHVAAHDLKSPVRSIGMYAKLLKKMAFDRGAGGEEIEFLDYIETFTDQAERLVECLLNFSILGEKAVELVPVDMSGLARQAISSLSAQVNSEGAVVEIEANLPPALADENLLAHVLQNLISNAMKYRGEEIPHIQISGAVRQDEVEYSVRDNGCGVDAKHSERIFEPFKRVAKPDSPDGVGLGLTICQRIIEAHHGRIWVEPTAGVGSVFKFTLPLAKDHDVTVFEKVVALGHDRKPASKIK